VIKNISGYAEPKEVVLNKVKLNSTDRNNVITVNEILVYAERKEVVYKKP
jgi:hypothetical protein